MPQYDIEVTEQHIAKGDRNDTGAYPIALAINENLGTAEDIKTDVEFMATSLHPCNTLADATILEHDSDLYWFISDFDAGHNVQPITVRVDTDTKFISRIDEGE